MTKLFAPAAERNGGPLGDVLAEVLPAAAAARPTQEPPLVLEVASGSGAHAARFAARFPHLRWLPTDHTPEALASIRAYVAEAQGENLLSPLELDARQLPWPVERADAVLCVNMLHIAPFSAAEGLFSGAGAILPTGGLLAIYGPFNVEGRFTSEGNRAFDADLRGRDPRLGLRDVEVVEQAAAAQGLSPLRRVAMPANNLTLLFRREERR